jgi:sulfate/thiosulfate-binding protein
MDLNAPALLACVAVAGFLLLAPGERSPVASAPLTQEAASDFKRPLYQAYDEAFARSWQQRTGQTISIQWSLEGLKRQAQVLVDDAVVAPVPLVPAFDVDSQGRRGLVPPEWESRRQVDEGPYTSTIVFLVRKGNPKAITGWSDLVRNDVAVRTADPMRAPGARWNYLAAWGHALRKSGGDDARAREFVARLFGKAGGLEASPDLALAGFIEDKAGDVLIAREAEARLAARAHAARGFEVVVPEATIRVEPKIVMPDRVVLRRSSLELAEAYLDFLHTPEAQSILAGHFFHPADGRFATSTDEREAPLELFTLEEVFGSWEQAAARHFAEGGELDQIMTKAAR